MGTALLNPPIYPSRAADFCPLFSCTLPVLLRQRIAGLRPDWRWSFRNKSSCKIRAQLRDRWLESLAGGSNGAAGNGLVVVSREEAERSDEDGQAWVIGIDPDVSGALAVVKGSETGCSAEVFDSPHSQVPVGKGMRKRLNPKSMVQIIRSLNAPVGTVAYIEQSSPFPKDGKQGWWSGGFGYGVWIGVLVASGFSVIPVPSVLWKANFGLLGRSFSKDDSRVAARELFPALSPMLKRKMDHGRAEALLIAAYGKGLKREKETAVAACTSET